MATVLLTRCMQVYVRRNNCLNLDLMDTVINKLKWTAYSHEEVYCHSLSNVVNRSKLQHQTKSTLRPGHLFLVNKQSFIIRYIHVISCKYNACSSFDQKNKKVSISNANSKDKTNKRSNVQVDKEVDTEGETGSRFKLGETRIKFKETTEKFKETTEKFKETTEKFKEKFEETIMKENIFTVPNYLCVTRIILSPVLGYLVLQSNYEFALGLFAFAGVTDLLDGFIARNFKNQQSMFGSFLDPMADKFLVFCLFLSLTYVNLIPIPLTSLIIARDVCLFGAGFYIRYLSLPPPKTLSRYFDATHATAQLSPTILSKFNTAIQLILVACTLGAPVFQFENGQFFQALWILTATTTTLSGISYMFSKNTYQLLKKIKDTRKN